MMSNKQDTVWWEKKFKKVENWTRWFNIIIFTLKEKRFWNIIMSNCITENIAAQITSYECYAVKAIKIIKTDIINDMFKNIENTDEFLII